MDGTQAKGGRSPGRPRSERSREAILKATMALLREGNFADLSIEQVAARAGVGKTTIYRWWPGKGPLAVEAFLEDVAPQIAFPESQSAVADLRAQVPLVAKAYRGEPGRILREILALGQADPETLKIFVAGYLEPRRSAAKAVLQRGVRQGELREGLDLDAVVDAIYGPIFHRLMTGHAPLDDSFVATLLDIVLHGTATG
jgi:AcrR family transcriptional regulator